MEKVNYNNCKYEVAWDKHRRKQAIKYLFNRKHLADDLFDYSNWWTVSFYWIKTLICLFFKRTNGTYLTGFQVVFWNVRESCGEYSGQEWDAYWVEYGIFKNWNVCIMSDSSY